MIQQDETEVFILIDGNENEYICVGSNEEFKKYKAKVNYFSSSVLINFSNDEYFDGFYRTQKAKNKIIIKQIKMNLEC